MKKLIISNLIIFMIIISCRQKDEKVDQREMPARGHERTVLNDIGWNLWLDSAATWKDDGLFLPPYNLAELPVNQPTCGWDELPVKGRNITLPATVEEHYWGGNGNSFGVAGDYLKLFSVYDEFLSRYDFRRAFPSVDDLTKSMGNISHYYQGRVIENARMNNIIDGYVINGWEEIKLENHSGIVDCYRNPKGNDTILSYYNQDLFIAVKAREKVFETGDETMVDFYIINEKGISGNFRLNVNAGKDGVKYFEKSFEVTVTGGNVYGEILVKNVPVTPGEDGYCAIYAELAENGNIIAKGSEKLFTVSANIEGSRDIEIMDTSGMFRKILTQKGITNIAGSSYNDHKPEASILLVGAADPPDTYPVRQEMLEWVASGQVLIIADNAAKWAKYLAKKEVFEFKGAYNMGILWYGGNYFVREHPLFKDLPVNTAFNWEYQCLAHYDRDRYALRIDGYETVVGAVSDHKQEVFSAVKIIPLGRGYIIISSLNIMEPIQEKLKSSVVAKKLLLNYIEHANHLLDGVHMGKNIL